MRSGSRVPSPGAALPPQSITLSSPVRVLPAKLGLLEDQLRAYGLDKSFSTVDFLYTVALCGPWHPAAQVSHRNGP